MSKRGSLSISTNAIVVLIIAVIMLGLIIGLVTRGFGAVEQQFLERIQQTEDSAPPPTGTEPITMSRKTIVSNAGELVGIKVGIRNTKASSGAVWLRPGGINCADSSITSVIDSNKEQYFAQNLETSESAEFTYIFELADTLQPGRYLCQLKAMNASSAGATTWTDSGITPYAQFTLTIE